MPLGGAKARRRVSITHDRLWALWKAARRMRESRGRQSEPDIYRLAEISVSE